MSECIIELYRNGTLSALDGDILTLEIAHPVQHYHFDPERSALDTDSRSKLNYGILTLNDTFTECRCAQIRTLTFCPGMDCFSRTDAFLVQITDTIVYKWIE